jgi:hypothetical protein
MNIIAIRQNLIGKKQLFWRINSATRQQRQAKLSIPLWRCVSSWFGVENV